MWNIVRPEGASTFAPQVDALYYMIWTLTMLFSMAVGAGVLFLAIRYRRGARVNRKGAPETDVRLEIGWTILPLVLGLAVFAWSAKIYIDTRRPPVNATEMFVIGKRWMWHFQHANGVRENNELHVPMGRPIKLTMISQDVIHSMYIPAFRIKQDVLPGRYTQEWFTATKPGRYRIYCSQYCGTSHSEMVGWIEVMEPAAFEKWLANDGTAPPVRTLSMAERGKEVYDRMACGSCHASGQGSRGGSLAGVAGSVVRLQGGRSVMADDVYLRESLLKPNEKVKEGYWPIMPAYADQFTEEQVLDLIAYMKTLGKDEAPSSAGSAAGGSR